ncbi:MAG: protein kinase domain-containing protein, partial [Longimicrobiales bacterium]
MSAPPADAELTEQLRTTLQGRYTVRNELGRGGMAIVYRALDLRNNREVAIKVLRPELAATIAGDRFLREIHIAGQLKHQRILPVYDSGDARGSPFFVMPIVEGESLRARIQREKQLPIPDALRIARDVAQTLEYAHTQAIVHRDVKPENILLSGEVPFVSDFGIARALEAAGGERLTESGVAMGTAAYISPEQAGGASAVDARSDVYALGCVLYEMLAGEPPFTGPSTHAIVALHLAERPRSLRVVRPAVPPELDQVIQRALAKVPADRFRSAAAFATALEAVSDTARLRRLRIRRRVTRLAVIGLLLTAIGVGLKVLIGRATPPLDASRVVVFPLAAGGQATAATGEDVAMMISAALIYTDPLKGTDGARYLEERYRENPGLISSSTAVRISKSRRARYFLEGAVRQDNDSATVVLRLHDVVGDSVLAEESATGAVAMPAFRIGYVALRRLIPKLLDPGREVDFAVLTEREPAAIALLVQGEREYRRTRFGPALDFFKRAVRMDSALAYAAVKGAQAANWVSLRREARELVSVALARDTLLPPRYRAFARGLDAYHAARADSAVFWLERALHDDPDWTEASMALGEVLYHLFPARWPLDSLAESQFKVALAADTTFTPAMLHLVEIATRRGDTRRARDLVNRLSLGEPDTVLGPQRAIMVECVERGPDRANLEERARANPVAVLHAAQQLAVAGAHPACAERAFRAFLAVSNERGFRWAALLGLQSLLAAQGRIADLT